MSRNILIVDDQEDILLILEREFRRRPGLSVIATSKAEEALRLVKEKRIDLVIADVRIGLESGFDLVRDINRAHPEVGAILMSAYRSSSNREQAADLGVVLFLEKPFQVTRLLEEVENYFNLRENPPLEPAETPAPSDSAGLANFKPQDLIQLFCLNGRNILLTVANSENEGKIYIQRGRVLHADLNGKTGEEAFYSIMQLTDTQLNVEDWDEQAPVSIKTSWEHLLLQSAIQFDHQV